MSSPFSSAWKPNRTCHLLCQIRKWDEIQSFIQLIKLGSAIASRSHQNHHPSKFSQVNLHIDHSIDEEYSYASNMWTHQEWESLLFMLQDISFPPFNIQAQNSIFKSTLYIYVSHSSKVFWKTQYESVIMNMIVVEKWKMTWSMSLAFRECGVSSLV